jgi:hypothetical protein
MSEAARSPERALNDLEVRLHEAEAPVLKGLRPGLSVPEAMQLLSIVGAAPEPALLSLYCWRDGAEGSGPQAELLNGARFLSLREAITTWQFELRLAAENEFLPGQPASEIFDPGWFPILQDAGGLVYVVEGLGAGRVLVVDRQDSGNPEELSSSMVEFLDGIARDGLDFKPAPLTADATVLVGRLESNEPRERTTAVRELTRKRPPAAFEPLVAMLNSQDSQARRNAALLLGALGDPRAVPVLIRCVAFWIDPDMTSARAGLAAIGTEGEMGHLEKALADGDSELRMDAIKGLAALRDARAVPALQAAASGDPDRLLREAASQALRALGRPQ